MFCIIGAMTQRLEQEVEMVASGSIIMSAQNTRAVIDHLRAELQENFDKDRVEFQQG